MFELNLDKLRYLPTVDIHNFEKLHKNSITICVITNGRIERIERIGRSREATEPYVMQCCRLKLAISLYHD